MIEALLCLKNKWQLVLDEKAQEAQRIQNVEKFCEEDQAFPILQPNIRDLKSIAKRSRVEVQVIAAKAGSRKIYRLHRLASDSVLEETSDYLWQLRTSRF